MTKDRLAAARSERGEVVLRTRPGDGAVELRVNGIFVMDTAETTSERLLAEAALQRTPGDRLRVLVGGLGLGFTVGRLLACDRVARVTVAEIEAALPSWHRAGLIPEVAGLLDDPRAEVVVGDVADVIAGAAEGSYDLVLLDVDNGPDSLVYQTNAALYRDDLLTRCRRATSRGGVTAIWSMSSSDPLLRAMHRVFSSVEVVPVPVRLGARAERYWLYLAQAEDAAGR